MEKGVNGSVKQEEIHEILFNSEIGWQEIIYDLINTEQLDPWDVNITVLTDKYMEKIKELEEADFFISSKVLLAAALLLRIKSEMLLTKYIQSIDDILFGKEEKKQTIFERIELDEEIPQLVPKSPIPRFKKVTLKELVESLNKAIVTENRRIKKEIINRNALRESSISLPRGRRISIKDKIKSIYDSLFSQLKTEEIKKISLNDFVNGSKEEKILSFSPLLHLENQNKVWLEQEAHFDEIHIWLNEVYLKHNPDPFAELRLEVAEEIENMDEEQLEKLGEIEEEFNNPLRN